MDEVLFRSSQKLESLQIQIGMVAAEGKTLLHGYAEHGKDIVKQLADSQHIVQSRDFIRNFYEYLLSVCREAQNTFVTLVTTNTKKVYDGFLQLFGRQLTRRDIYFITVGFVSGGMVGMGLGLLIFKKNTFRHYMQAVQCFHYMGMESASVVEDAIAPHECGKNEVLVNVKAASVHVVDAQICDGYGRYLRKLFSHYQRSNSSGLPVTLGRDCTGIITDIGSNVTRLEVGEEVWLTVPFWASGTMCQTVLVPESNVARKPKSIGYESACSLPYAGSIALQTLKQSGITSENAKNKRVLIMDGCTPVGCVLIQILKLWSAHVTVTCYKRASPVAKALGANCVITLETDLEAMLKSLRKEIELRDPFNLVVCTKTCLLTMEEFKNLPQPGAIVHTTPPHLKSDSYGFFMRFMFGNYFKIRCIFEKLLGLNSGYFEETHICHKTLDHLKSFVEKGQLQTVVDKVYHPQDIEVALNHIQSPEAIGSTVITFR